MIHLIYQYAEATVTTTTRNAWQCLAYRPLGASVSPPSGKRAKNARGISLPSLRQHYLVAMATSLDKLENKVQMDHLYIKRFHMVKRL